MNVCLNCSNPLSEKFCGECGQKAATHRFTIHEWLHEIPHSIFHVDGGFFVTFKNLCLRPGNMIREYLAGRRKSYFSPFLYLLIMCGVFVVISLLAADASRAKPEIVDFASAYNYLLTNYYKPIIVAMVLPLALATRLVFWRAGFNFAEHLVLNAFVIAQMIIGDIIVHVIGASHLADDSKAAVGLLDFSLKTAYTIWAYWQFFKPRNKFFGALQVVFAAFLGSIFASLMVVAAAYLLFLVKGGGH